MRNSAAMSAIPVSAPAAPATQLLRGGLLQRLRPRLVYLTDGGPLERVPATREGLARIGLQDSAVEVVGDRLRFTHPLLASAVYQKIPPARRRELHARLATIVPDPERRARHLALSVEGPDVAVAAALVGRGS